MKLFVDLDREASSSLIEGFNNPRVVSPKTIFFQDSYQIKLRFLENESWVGDPSASIKLKIGTFPTTYLINDVVGVWDGSQYLFGVDFDTQEFDSAISGKLEINGFLEIQVEEGTHSKTILQIKAKFRNTFAGGVQVELVEPLEPSEINLELITKPNAPNVPTLNITPTAPSEIDLGKKPTAPSEVELANLSIPPRAPRFTGLQIQLPRPLAPSFPQAVLHGLPSEPSQPFPSLVIPRPLAPSEVTPIVVTAPFLDEVNAFEVVQHQFHKDHHRFLYLKTQGRFEQRFNGRPLISEDVPFEFSHVDQFGCPVYQRDSQVELHDLFKNIPTQKEVIRLLRYQAPNFFYFGTNNPLAMSVAQRATDYGGGGHFNVTFTNTGQTYYRPKGVPFDHGGQDHRLYAIECVIGYDYGSNVVWQNQTPYSFNFRTFANHLIIPQTQQGKLGLKDYGGTKLSYFETSRVDAWNYQASHNSFYEDATTGIETPSSDFKVSFLPAFNPQVAEPPEAISNLNVQQVFQIDFAPSQVETSLIDFQPNRYSPTIWIDANQEESNANFERITNFANSGFEVLHNPQGLKTAVSNSPINGLPTLDFSTTQQSYKIPNNAFGRHLTNIGGEIEMFFVFRPLDFDPRVTTHWQGQTFDPVNRDYRAHAFVNNGGDYALTAHLPWENNQIYFDAGRSPSARASSRGAIPLNQPVLLYLHASTTDELVEIFLNGERQNFSSFNRELIVSNLLLGGWGSKGLGQAMHVGEVLFFKNKLGRTRQEKVEGYLAHKWGLQNDLIASHPYKSQQPNNVGEYRELEPFPRPTSPLVLEMYPNAPSAPLVGFPPNEKPSDLAVLSFVNEPSEITSETIAPIRFFEEIESQEIEVSAMNFNGIISDAPIFEEQINERINTLLAKDSSENATNVFWEVSNVSTNDIAPTIEEITSQTAQNFSLGLQENKPFLAEGETKNLSFEVKIQSSLGQNVLPVNMILRGVNQGRVITEIENVSIGGEAINDGNALNFDNYTNQGGDYWFIPYDTQNTRVFKITLTNPEKITPRLYFRWWGELYNGNYQYYTRSKKYERLFYLEHELALNQTIIPEDRKYVAVYNYMTKTHSEDTTPFVLHDVPIEIKCTNINEIIQGVSREYTIEVKFNQMASGALDVPQQNLISYSSFKNNWINGGLGYDFDIVKNDRFKLRGFQFTTDNHNTTPDDPEAYATFTSRYSNKFERYYRRTIVTPYIVPDIYTLRQPSVVRARLGNPVWQAPIEVKAKPLTPNFPTQTSFVPSLEKVKLYNGNRSFQSDSNSYTQGNAFHAYDPTKNAISWNAEMLLKTIYSDSTTGLGKTWQWGFNLKKLEDGTRFAPTFIHHTKLQNIGVQSVGIKHQVAYNFPNAIPRNGLEIPLEIQEKLEPKNEFLITFPSGIKQITQFGGYVQTSRNLILGVYGADKNNPIWQFKMHPSNANHLMKSFVFKDSTSWAWQYLSTKIEKAIPLLVLPIEFGGQCSLLNPLQAKFLKGETGVDSRWGTDEIYTSFNQVFPNEKALQDYFLPNVGKQFYYNKGYLQRIGDLRTINGIEYAISSAHKNDATILPFSNFTYRLKFEAYDRKDSSVHPLWGSDHVIWSNNVPRQPIDINFESNSEGTTKLQFSDWQLIRDQITEKPTPPTIRAIITPSDLVASRTSIDDVIYNGVIPSEANYVIFNEDQGTIKRGDVWRVESIVNGGAYQAEQERNLKLNLKYENLDGLVSRQQINFSQLPNISRNLWEISPTGYNAQEKPQTFSVYLNKPNEVIPMLTTGWREFLRKYSLDNWGRKIYEPIPKLWNDITTSWQVATHDLHFHQSDRVIKAGSFVKIHDIWIGTFGNPFSGFSRVSGFDFWYWDSPTYYANTYYLRVEEWGKPETLRGLYFIRDINDMGFGGVLYRETFQPPSLPSVVTNECALESTDLTEAQTTLSASREITSVSQLMDNPTDFSTISDEIFVLINEDSPNFSNAILRPIAVVDCLINSGLDQYLRHSDGSIQYQINQADGSYEPILNPDYTPYFTIKGLSCVVMGQFGEPVLNVIIKPDTTSGGYTFGQSTFGNDLVNYEPNLRTLTNPNFDGIYKSKYYRHWKNRIFQNFISPYNTATQLVGKYLVLARDYGTGLKQGDIIKVHSVNYVQPAEGVTGHKDVFYIKQGEPYPLTIPKIDMATNEAWGIFADWGFELVEE